MNLADVNSLMIHEAYVLQFDTKEYRNKINHKKTNGSNRSIAEKLDVKPSATWAVKLKGKRKCLFFSTSD